MANAWTETARYETPTFDATIIAQHPDRRVASAYQCNPGSIVQSDGVTPAPVTYACNISSVGPVVPFSAETHKTTEQHRTSRPIAALIASVSRANRLSRLIDRNGSLEKKAAVRSETHSSTYSARFGYLASAYIRACAGRV